MNLGNKPNPGLKVKQVKKLVPWTGGFKDL